MAPANARGRCQGAVVMTFGTAQMVGPKLGSWVWEREGPGTLWASCLGIGALVAVALAVTAPARRRRLAR
jgi:MFS family permease